MSTKETKAGASVEEVVECILAIEYQQEGAGVAGAEVDLDLVPDDPGKRNWASLSDFELNLWRKALVGETGDVADAHRERVRLLIRLRDEIQKLSEDSEFEMPADLDESRPSYTDHLRAIEIVEAEKERRTTERENWADAIRLRANDDSIALDIVKLAGEVAAGSLAPITTEEMDVELMIDESADKGDSLIHQSSRPEQMSLFDYGQLDQEVADRVQRNTREIRERIVSSLHNMLVIGQKLRDNKFILGRRYYPEWLASEIGFSKDSSERFIRFADYVDENPHFAEILLRFHKTAVHVLLAPSVPEEAREEAIRRADAGETITTPVAREITNTRRTTTTTQQRVIDHSPASTGPFTNEESAEPDESGASSDAQRAFRPAEPVEAEVVATGRTINDLLLLLKSHENGMLHNDLVRMGFTEATIEIARVSNQIEKAIGKWYVATPGESAKPAAADVVEKDKRTELEGLVKGENVSVTFSFHPALIGICSVGVCVGADRTKTKYDTMDVVKVRLPDLVLDLISNQIVAANKEAEQQDDTAKKPTATKQVAAKKAAPAKSKTTKPAAKKVVAKKTAVAKPATAKKATAAKKKGGG